LHNNLNKTVLIIIFVFKYITATNIKLRNLREERKISQALMAKTLNISQPQYQRKEVGEAAFTLDEL
jgi:DNA-binding XRE family transcriptional regulator